MWTRTMLGPVGRLRVAEAAMPTGGMRIPKRSEAAMRLRKLVVAMRAAAAGMTMRALSRRAPSIFKPTATAAATSKEKT